MVTIIISAVRAARVVRAARAVRAAHTVHVVHALHAMNEVVLVSAESVEHESLAGGEGARVEYKVRTATLGKGTHTVGATWAWTATHR